MTRLKKTTEGSMSRDTGPLVGVKIDTSKYDASFRTKGKDSPVQRHRKKHPKKTPLKDRGFGESVARAQLETVKRKGNGWALYDDKTGIEMGVYQSRAQAWQAQRMARAHQKSNEAFGGKLKKTPNPMQRDQHHKKQPKVKNGLGTKHVKAIRPLKPVKPKALKSVSKIGEQNMRRLTIPEIKTLIVKEAKKQGITEETLAKLRTMMGEPKDPSKMKIKQTPWGKADHAKLTKWVSALGLKEMLQPK